MDFKLDKIRMENLAAHLRSHYRLAGITHTRSVGQQLHMFAIDMRQHLVSGLLHHIDALHSHCDHLRFRGFDSLKHTFGRGEFSSPHKEARGKFATAYF